MAYINLSLYFTFLFIALFTKISKSTSFPFYYYCSNTTIFNSNTKYHTNLNTLFHSLTSNATNPTGYYATSVGTNHDNNSVYGIFLCRGDLTTHACRDCVSNATKQDLPMTYCPNRKTAIIWYDECMVRYSNESFIGKMENVPSAYGWNLQNVTANVTGFAETLKSLMDRVVKEAVVTRSGKKFGTNVTSFSSFKPVYGLAQCTPDLSSEDCNRCLQSAVLELRISKGARVLQPSCNVRYESYPFFNGAAKLLSPPPSPLPQLLPPPPPVANFINKTAGIEPPSGGASFAPTLNFGLFKFVFLLMIILGFHFEA